MISKHLQPLLNDPQFVDTYARAMLQLEASRVLNVLKQIAQPIIPWDKGESYAALQGMWHAGYSAALNDLENFVENYLKPAQAANLPEPTYGGDVVAMREGYLTKEELDALRTGSSVKYELKRNPASNQGSGNTSAKS